MEPSPPPADPAAALEEAIAACRRALREALAARDEGQIAALQAHLSHLLRKKAALP